MPENQDNPDAAAIEALIAESTPEERAEGFKTQGNDALRTGLKVRKKFYLREAVTAYTKGLELKCSHVKLNAQLLCNRAHVHLQLGNNKSALEDGMQAAALDSTNFKAFFRAAKAALNLGDFDKALAICHEGRQGAPDMPDQPLPAHLQDAHRQQQRAAQQKQDRLEAAAAARGPARQLATVLTSLRGWRVGAPQLSIGDRKPHVDPQGLVHWPVLFYYPEAGQQDAIEDFCESDSLTEHLDAMFSPMASPLEWDEQHNYTRERLELYYLSHAATPLKQQELTEVSRTGGWTASHREPQRYGPKAARWVQVTEAELLGEVLSRSDYVIPGVPVFFVVATGSRFRERFLSD
eukprot:jgi/Astpho2/2794/gw1.00050.278.1_t